MANETLREALTYAIDMGMPSGLDDRAMDDWEHARSFAESVLEDPTAKPYLLREALSGFWRAGVGKADLSGLKNLTLPSQHNGKPLTLVTDTQFSWVAYTKDVNEWWNKAVSYDEFCEKVPQVDHPLNTR